MITDLLLALFLVAIFIYINHKIKSELKKLYDKEDKLNKQYEIELDEHEAKIAHHD